MSKYTDFFDQLPIPDQDVSAILSRAKRRAPSPRRALIKSLMWARLDFTISPTR